MSDAIVWRADAEDGGSVWVHANGEWGHEGGSMSWALDALASHVARLTPSGQVAEDRNIVAMELGSHPSQAKTQAAAARLAALAQGYEAMKVERDAARVSSGASRDLRAKAESERDRLHVSLTAAEDARDSAWRRLRAVESERDAAVTESSTHLEWMKEERTRAEQAEKERDAVLARAEEAEKQARLAWERHAEKDRAYGDAISQRDAAVADNAALLRALMASLAVPITHELRKYVRSKFENEPHPGAELLKERKEFHARLDAIETAVVETVGGKVEGAPVSRINYLQRLRELVIIEQAFVALSRLRAGDAAEQARQSETIKALTEIVESDLGMSHSSHSALTPAMECRLGRCPKLVQAIRLAEGLP